MSIEFRSPSISAQTTEGQLQQLQSFLRQHVQQLNWVMKNLETEAPDTLTQAQVIEAAAKSAEVFGAVYRKLVRKQAQENFVGAAKRTVFSGGSLSQGASAAADMEAVGRYTVFVAVTSGGAVVCGRSGSAITGPGLTLTCGETAITVTEAESPVTELYAVV